MRQKLEITLIPSTENSAKAFVADLDLQIAELEENLYLLKTARGAVARTFGMDRRDGSFVENLVDSATRASTEIDEDDLNRALSIGRFGEMADEKAAQ